MHRPWTSFPWTCARRLRPWRRSPTSASMLPGWVRGMGFWSSFVFKPLGICLSGMFKGENLFQAERLGWLGKEMNFVPFWHFVILSILRLNWLGLGWLIFGYILELRFARLRPRHWQKYGGRRVTLDSRIGKLFPSTIVSRPFSNMVFYVIFPFLSNLHSFENACHGNLQWQPACFVFKWCGPACRFHWFRPVISDVCTARDSFQLSGFGDQRGPNVAPARASWF